jgi:hypothetical protein
MMVRKQARAMGPQAGVRQPPTTATTGTWADLQQHCAKHNLGKAKCVGKHGEGFGGLKTQGENHKYPFDIEEVLLLEGEKIRDHLHGTTQNRKGADCVFFLRFADGSIRVTIIELKTGNDDEVHFTLQLQHSEQDCNALAKQLRIAKLSDFFFGAPRLPDTVRGGRKGFQKKFKDRFDVTPDLATLLDNMAIFLEPRT